MNSTIWLALAPGFGTGRFRADALPEGMEEDDLCDDQFAR
ncbi:Uncharacterised protein [Escherichia coli]|uniref:Uncharacterized protein n=1 Tax=Escherichia coli TaxID=562 RepID=A0A377E4H7_ECOLX|nr:Uncharacterised protein [Escherichia coli]